MYKKIVTPKKITQQWLDQAFAPLRNYLNSHHSDHAERIIGLTMFMANQDDRFYYKHKVTKGYIVFDQAGQLVSCDESALEYEFDWMSDEQTIRPFQERFIHPNVSNWVRNNLHKKDAKMYREEVAIFLQDLWGPFVNYDFSDLAVGYPPRNLSFRHSLYIYPKARPAMIVFEFIGDAIAEGRCTPQETRQLGIRQQMLSFGGWRVMSFIRESLEFDLSFMRDRLAQLLESGD